MCFLNHDSVANIVGDLPSTPTEIIYEIRMKLIVKNKSH